MSRPTQTSPIDLLKAAIRQEIADWAAAHPDIELSEVNRGAHPLGCCSDFVSAVYERLGGPDAAYALGISEIGIEAFMAAGRMDRELIAASWPKVKPPEGLDWDGLDRLAEDADFSPATHEWIVCYGIHFDCECPDGVENPFDLPFFKRAIASWQIENAAPQMYRP